MGRRKQTGSEPAVADRILNSAARLFRFQGYLNTGVNQVIEEAHAAKASFYQHYPSKDDLGRTYLQNYARAQADGLALLMKRNPDPRDFVRAWVRLVKREVRGGTFFGCPMANFRAQVGAVAPPFEDLIAGITESTLESLSLYLEQAVHLGHLPSQVDIARTARRLFSSYHGTLQVWRLSGNAKVLDEFEPMCLALLSPVGG